MKMKAKILIFLLALSSGILARPKEVKHWGLDAKVFYSLDALGKDLAKKHQLQYLNSGCGGNLVDERKTRWALNFTSSKNTTIDEVRPLIAELSYQLLFKMYHDEIFKKFYKDSIFIDENMGFKLAFWDRNVDRPLYPYLAQVRLAAGNIYYHYADPETQALQDPIIEPLSTLNLKPDYK